MSARTVLITGANRGIGLETARQLAARGFHVVAAARDEAAGARTAAELQAAGGRASALRLDVSDSASVRAAAAEFGRRHDRLDVLINNAGVYPDRGWNILTATRALMTGTLQTNTLGPLEVTQAFLPHLQQSATPR